MKVQFRSTRMDGSRGEWHDVLTPDGFGVRWAAPVSLPWIAIEFREVPEPVEFARMLPSDPNPPCTCDGGNSFHASDCPT